MNIESKFFFNETSFRSNNLIVTSLTQERDYIKNQLKIVDSLASLAALTSSYICYTEVFSNKLNIQLQNEGFRDELVVDGMIQKDPYTSQGY